MFDFSENTRASSGHHQFDHAGKVVRDQACRRFDGKLHNEISSAKTDEDWKKIVDEVIKAHKVEDFREPHGLRDNVLKRFIEEAPGPAKRRFYEATKPTPVVMTFRRDDKKSRQEIEARRAANRAARLVAQPARGSASGGGNKPGKQKGGKKK